MVRTIAGRTANCRTAVCRRRRSAGGGDRLAEQGGSAVVVVCSQAHAGHRADGVDFAFGGGARYRDQRHGQGLASARSLGRAARRSVGCSVPARNRGHDTSRGGRQFEHLGDVSVQRMLVRIVTCAGGCTLPTDRKAGLCRISGIGRGAHADAELCCCASSDADGGADPCTGHAHADARTDVDAGTCARNGHADAYSSAYVHSDRHTDANADPCASDVYSGDRGLARRVLCQCQPGRRRSIGAERQGAERNLWDQL